MTTWTSPSFPPPFTRDDYGWPMSVEVLCATKGGGYSIGYYRDMSDEYQSYTPDWISACSEGWNITDQVIGWQYLDTHPEEEKSGPIECPVCNRLHGTGVTERNGHPEVRSEEEKP